MNTDQLFAHYENVTDAPDTIPRLRRFILDLAVRGKLVEQDPADEPASELLTVIAVEKARLVEAKEIKKSEVDPISSKESPFETPHAWVWTRLGSIGDWGAGSTPSRGNVDLYGGPVTWLKSGELNDNISLVGSEETITEFAVQKGSFRINQPGDVLIAMYGATIGKLAILAEVAVTNQAVCGCTPFSGVLNHFLFLFLLSQRKQFHTASGGGAQPNISKVKIVSTPFPLPPLAEQRRIVTKVDELMALCERLEAARAAREGVRDRLAAASLVRLSIPDPNAFQDDTRFALEALAPFTIRPDQIKLLRQTILNLAVRGKLVPQDAGDGSVSELLKKIEAERKARIANGEIRRERLLARVDVEPFEAPDGWVWLPLGDTGNIFSGNSINATTREKLSQTKIGRPFIATKDVGYGLDLIDYNNGLLVPAPDDRFKIARAQSVLICAEGGSAGRKIGMTDRDICFGNKLLANETWSVVAPKFVMFVYLSGFFYEQFAAEMTGIISGISINKFLQLPFPLPPLAEQQRIVAKIDELMPLCDRLETSLATVATTRRLLLDTLLAEALDSAAHTRHAAE